MGTEVDTISPGRQDFWAVARTVSAPRADCEIAPKPHEFDQYRVRHPTRNPYSSSLRGHLPNKALGYTVISAVRDFEC